MNEMKQEPLTGAPGAVDAATAEVAASATGPRLPRRMLRIALMLIVPLLLVIGGGYYWLASGGKVSTDDAQIKQDIVSVSAQVNGPITQVAVRNGQTVKQGALLFRIDPAPYRVALEQAQAQLAAAQLQNRELRTQADRHRRRHRRSAGGSRDQAARAGAADDAAQGRLHHPVRL